MQMRLVVILLLGVNWSYAGASEVRVASFEAGELTGWQEQLFVGRTVYEFIDFSADRALRATSRGSASGLFKKININLEKTPFLSWRWQANRLPAVGDERIKENDDFAVRVYLIFQRGTLLPRREVINYVWSVKQAKAAMWKSPYTSSVKMIALRSGEAELGRWLSEKRHVLEDYQKLFGRPPEKLHGVAVMTDSDNSNSIAEALYGDIFFSPK